MAYTYDFKDNVVYGADDINAIRASIMTKGVIEEASDSCMVVKSTYGVTIKKGQALFADGCRIAVDSGGVELGFVSGKVNYVYFYNNTLMGVCEALCTTTAPKNDYVLLAEIDHEGNITDKRVFSEGKMAENERFAESFSAYFITTDDIEEGSVMASITLPKSNCSLIDFNMTFVDAYMHVRVFPKEDGYVIWNYENGLIYMGETHEFVAASIGRKIKYELNGNVLTLRLTYISDSSSLSRSVKIAGVCMR